MCIVRVRAQEKRTIPPKKKKKKDMPGRELNLQSPAYKAENLPAGTSVQCSEQYLGCNKKLLGM